ncbi:unnamed protein product [Calypogeia fissa]
MAQTFLYCSLHYKQSLTLDEVLRLLFLLAEFSSQFCEKFTQFCTAGSIPTSIPKIFEVSGLVNLAFLRDEAAPLPDGGELRATTQAKLVAIIPEFNNYWYEGCKIEGDKPLWPHHFQSKYPHPDQQAEFFKAKEASGTWLVFDVVYKKCEEFGDFTFTYAKFPSQTENTHVFPRPDGQTKWVNPALFPTTILQMDPSSSVKKHVLAGKDLPRTNGECTLDPPEEYVLCPKAKDECGGLFEVKDNCLQSEFDALNLNNTGGLSTNCGRVAQ